MRNIQTIFNWGLGTIFAVFVSVSSAVAAQGDKSIDLEVRKLASWSLPDINGDTVDFSPVTEPGYKIVLFWATWCPYCKALMPHLEAFRAQMEEKALPSNDNSREHVPIKFLALNVWEDGDPKGYVSKTDFNYRLVLQADEVAKEYGVKGTPGLFLVNNKNEILYERRSGTSPKQVITDLEFALENERVAREEN